MKLYCFSVNLQSFTITIVLPALTQCLLRRRVDWIPTHRKVRTEERHGSIQPQQCCWCHPRSTCKRQKHSCTHFRLWQLFLCIDRQFRWPKNSWASKYFEKIQGQLNSPEPYLAQQTVHSSAKRLSEGHRFRWKIRFCGRSTSKSTLHLRFPPRNLPCWTLWRHRSSTWTRECTV